MYERHHQSVVKLIVHELPGAGAHRVAFFYCAAPDKSETATASDDGAI